jgi:CheY-like chemotaxis protein
MRVLIADDDYRNRKLVAGILSTKFEHLAVASGEEAFQAFKNAWDEWRPFTHILLDIMMPGGTGDEILRLIRGEEGKKRVLKYHQAKIYMVTANSEAEIVKRCISDQCDGYILKPINGSLLLRRLEGRQIQMQLSENHLEG